MSPKLKLDFEKRTKSKSVIDILSNGMQDDPEKDVLLLSLKECLAKLAKGNKLPYMAANYLLANILNALQLEDGDISDEITLVTLPASQADESILESLDNTVHGSPEGASGSGAGLEGSPSTNKTNPNPEKNSEKKREVCRFYARGHCTKKGDCRFEHPQICKIFRQFGIRNNDPKGCEGKCNQFHPNACRSSVKDRTCTWPECRFFHLKGTKKIVREQHGSTNHNWRSKNSPQDQERSRTNPGSKQSQKGTAAAPKNGRAGLSRNQKSKNKTNPNRNPAHKTEQVTKEEKLQLGQTLDAIMKRLTAMESRQTPYIHPQVQPLLSPAVPQPGTQTQFQWGSPNPWTQSQTQH